MKSAPGSPAQGWFSRERILLLALLLTTLLALYVCYRIFEPFIPAVTIAVAAAVATTGLQNWLRRRFQSRTAAAAVGVVLVACLIVIPLTFLISYLVRQIIASIHTLQAGGGFSEWRTIVHLPAAVDQRSGLGRNEPRSAGPIDRPRPETGRSCRWPARRVDQTGHATGDHAVRTFLSVPRSRKRPARPAQSRAALR